MYGHITPLYHRPNSEIMPQKTITTVTQDWGGNFTRESVHRKTFESIASTLLATHMRGEKTNKKTLLNTHITWSHLLSLRATIGAVVVVQFFP